MKQLLDERMRGFVMKAISRSNRGVTRFGGQLLKQRLIERPRWKLFFGLEQAIDKPLETSRQLNGSPGCGDRADEELAWPKVFDSKTHPLECTDARIQARLEFQRVGYGLGQEKLLSRDDSLGERLLLEPFVANALMGRMLIDQNEFLAVIIEQVGLKQTSHVLMTGKRACGRRAFQCGRDGRRV